MMNVPDIWSAKNAAMNLQNILRYAPADPAHVAHELAEMAVGLGMPPFLARQMDASTLMLYVFAVLVGAAE